MDLKRSLPYLGLGLLSIGFSAQAWAAPQLRLDTTAIGPISVATGSNGPAQTINATNAGDGNLTLRATPSVSWLSANVGQSQSCGTVGICNPITINLNTNSLQAGTYTGGVTISDPNAIDAPQTIFVTVAVGGGVPGSLTFYVPSNGNPVSQTFSTAKVVSTTVNAPSQVSLSVAAPSGGSFASVFSYTVTARANAGAGNQAYNGSIAVSGSTVASENKTVPVTINVTSSPIAQASSLSRFRIAQGASKQTQYIAVSNAGSGTISVSGATAATSSGGNWASASIVNGYVAVVADPAGLSPGSYAGTITVNSNAANSSITVPVALDVVASGPPVVQAGGVVNNATFDKSAIGQGELPAIFGEQFTTGDAQSATTLPLPTTLGGARVFVNDSPAPVYYVSQNQINFQMPIDAAPGQGVVRVERDGQRGNSVAVVIAQRAPKLLIAVTPAGAVASTPFGGPAAPIQAGSYMTIYALGLGQTSPAVRSGEASPSNPLAVVPGNNLVYFGNGGLFGTPVSQIPQFIGLTPGLVGLYQINVSIPSNAPKGADISVFLQGDAGTSNSLHFSIQ